MAIVVGFLCRQLNIQHINQCVVSCREEHKANVSGGAIYPRVCFIAKINSFEFHPLTAHCDIRKKVRVCSVSLLKFYIRYLQE
jgi:hypothetical protein